MPKQRVKITDEKDYTTIAVPNSLIVQMDTLIGTRGFKSRGEITKDALRDFLEKYKVKKHLLMRNHDDRGAKVWDSEIKMHADIQITPKGIYCPLCDARKCEHIRFMLKERDVWVYVQKRIKEGWKIELPEES